MNMMLHPMTDISPFPAEGYHWRPLREAKLAFRSADRTSPLSAQSVMVVFQATKPVTPSMQATSPPCEQQKANHLRCALGCDHSSVLLHCYFPHQRIRNLLFLTYPGQEEVSLTISFRSSGFGPMRISRRIQWWQ